MPKANPTTNKSAWNSEKTNQFTHLYEKQHEIESLKVTIHYAQKRKFTNGMTHLYEKQHNSVTRWQILKVLSRKPLM